MGLVCVGWGGEQDRSGLYIVASHNLPLCSFSRAAPVHEVSALGSGGHGCVASCLHCSYCGTGLQRRYGIPSLFCVLTAPLRPERDMRCSMKTQALFSKGREFDHFLPSVTACDLTGNGNASPYPGELCTV